MCFLSTTETPCASAPCYNGGSCTNVGDSFECRCTAGFVGDRCEIEGKKIITLSTSHDPLAVFRLYSLPVALVSNE
jgi:hypothetical protein